jgi:hypothetical protein
VADSRVLLAGLKEYRLSLERHLIQLRDDYNNLERFWLAFSAVYEGDAADQFRAGWLRTAERFNEYLEQTQKIHEILEERIEYLELVNRTEGLLD